MSTPITPATHTLTLDSVSKTIDANLVKDGGFKDETLSNWTSTDAGSGTSEHDPLVMYEGFPSVKLTITNTTDNAERYQDIYPDPDSTSFEFSARIQTENLGADDDDKFVCIDVYYSDGTSDLAADNADQKLTPSYDTQEWEHCTGSFSTNGAKQIDYIRVRCRLADISNQSGTGYMWVTQLVIIESANIREGETYTVDNDGDICVVPQLKITGNTVHVTDQIIKPTDGGSGSGIFTTALYYAQGIDPTQNSLSKLFVYVKRTGAPDDDLIIELVPLASGDPDEATVLAATTLSKDTITTSFRWHDVSLPFTNLDITKEYVLLFRTDATNLADGSVEYVLFWTNTSVYAADSYYSSDSGSTWGNYTDTDIAIATKHPIHTGEPIKYRSDEYSSEDGTEYEMGKVTTYEKQAQTFLCDFTNRIYSVILKPYTKTGTPTDEYVIVSIQDTEWDSTNSRWQPSGLILCETKIALADWEALESTTFAEGKILEVVFDIPPLLKKQENYAIVIERSGALSDTNHLALHGSDTSNDNYADGKALYWDGDSWEVGNANNDLYFAMRYVIDDSNIKIHNSTTGETLELEGQLLTNTKLQINRDGRGTYTHDYFDDVNWDESPYDFVGDIRNVAGGDYLISATSISIGGGGAIICKYDLIFPCLRNPTLSYKFNGGSYIIYYSLDGAHWIRLTSGGDEDSITIAVKIPIEHIAKLYLKLVGVATLNIKEWEVFADLDCSSAIGTLRLPGIGNSSCKSLFSNLNSKYTLDWEWTEVDNCSEYFVISDEPKYGYEMTAQVIPIGNPTPHTYIRTLKNDRIIQRYRSSFTRKIINVIDYSTNFVDLAKLREYLNDQRLVYVKTKYEFMQGILQEVPYKIISGEVDFRRIVIQLDETRQVR